MLPSQPRVHLVDSARTVDWTGKLRWMKPTDAYQLQYDATWEGHVFDKPLPREWALSLERVRDDPTYNHITERLREGRPIDPVVVEKLHDGTVMRTDGLHRTAAAMDLGIEIMPVAIVAVNE